MKTIDWSKADDWIESYVSAISNPNDIPGRYGRTWLELEADRVGLVEDGRGWQFGECHAAWYAALIRCGKLYAVNSLEKRIFRLDGRQKRTTVQIVRMLLNGRLRDSAIGAMLRDMLSGAVWNSKV